MRNIMVSSIAILASTFAYGGDLTMKIAGQATHALVAERVSLLLTISSDKPFTLPESLSTCGMTHPPPIITVVNESGEKTGYKIDQLCGSIDYDGKNLDRFVKEYDRNATLEFGLFMLPGKYKIQASYRYENEDYQRDLTIQPGMSEKGLWRGRLESNTIYITVKKPGGVDAAALDAVAKYDRSKPISMHNYPAMGYTPELLAKYPDSRYAALALLPYIVFKIEGHRYQSDFVSNALKPAKIARQIRRGQFPGANSVPTESGWRSMPSKEIAIWQNEWISRIRNNQPDLIPPGQAELTMALNELAWGNSKNGASTIHSLTGRVDMSESKWIRDFLQEWENTPAVALDGQ